MALHSIINANIFFDEEEIFPEEERNAVFEAFKAGDTLAMKKIFDERINQLMGFLLKKFWSVPRPEIEDIVAIKFAKLYYNREKMKCFDHVSSWIYKACARGCADYLKKNKFHRCPMEWIEESDGQHDMVTVIDVGEVKENDEIALRMIHDAIDRLSPTQRKIIRLLFFDGKKTSEISDILKLGRQTILNHKTDALNRLRQWVKPQFEEAAYG